MCECKLHRAGVAKYVLDYYYEFQILKHTLATKAFTENECGAPIRDNTKAVVIAAMIGMSFAFIAFVLRIMSRFTGASGKFWWDDAVMCLVIVRELGCPIEN